MKKSERDALARGGSRVPRVPITRAGCLAACLSLSNGDLTHAAEARCWIDRGAVVVPAAYGPIAGDFILDLSQAKSQLHDTAARVAGWPDDTARWTLRLAGQTWRSFPMKVVDLDARSAGFPTNIAGVLGADMLGRLTLDLNLKPCRLRLTHGLPRRDVRGLELRMIDGVPAILAGVSDGAMARTGWFAIDTASSGSHLADAAFSRPLPKGVDPSDRTSPPARLRAVSIAGILVEQTPAGLLNPVPPGLAGALGLSIWARIHLRISGRAINARPSMGGSHR